ncbi:MAG: hypothetical protein H6993_06180 [Pseudomonadales bacterium]|nr:hypothetical protein [Pseudomonadales bacterium]MCP5183532.1 hypothetical protein [Pseudomonadales bacterium]
MKYSVVPALLSTGLALAIGSAHAAPPRADLSTDLVGPATAETSTQVQFNVTTRNVGSRRADGSAVDITLPVAFAVAAQSTECDVVGNSLHCDLGSINAGASHTITFNVDLPAQQGAYTLTAAANTSTRESSLNNNTDTLAMQVNEPAPPPPPATFPITADTDLGAQVCYGLHSPLVWADCTPSSILEGVLTLQLGGSVDTHDPGYYATWSQATSSDIQIEIYQTFDNSHVSTWSGTAVSSDCFEGTTIGHTTTVYGAWRGCRQ